MSQSPGPIDPVRTGWGAPSDGTSDRAAPSDDRAIGEQAPGVVAGHGASWQPAAHGQSWQPGPSGRGGYPTQPEQPGPAGTEGIPGDPALREHPAPSGYPVQPGHPAQQDYQAQPGYSTQQDYQAHPGYPTQPGHQPQPGGHPFGPPVQGHPWVPIQPPGKPSALPVELRQYHEFLRTPRMRWWRPIAAIAMGAVLFLLANLMVSAGAMIYDISVGNTTLENYSSMSRFKATPAFFFANNVGLALCIPIAALTQWACFGQRPRWMASVTGAFRWRWFGECVVWMLPVFLLSLVIDVALGGLPSLRVNASTGFMIAAILVTTPLQAAGEEYLLRGLGQRAIGAWLPRTAGLVVSTAVTAGIFMYLHGAGDPWLNVFYVLFAATASVLVWRTGGLEAAIAMHVVNNMVSMTFLPFTDFSEMFNREAGTGSPWVLLQMMIMLAAATLVLWRAKLRGVVTMSAPGAPQPPSVSPVAQPIPQQAYPPSQPWRPHDGNHDGSW